jgi:hypothetical protein
MCIQFKTLLLNILLYQLVRCLFKAAGYDGKPINNKRPLLKGLLKYFTQAFLYFIRMADRHHRPMS